MNEKVIVFTDGVSTTSELCRDNKMNFIPNTGEFVSLISYDNYNGSEDVFWRVIQKTVSQDILYIHLVRMPKSL